jgi:hypothetical protein
VKYATNKDNADGKGSPLFLKVLPTFFGYPDHGKVYQKHLVAQY